MEFFPILINATSFSLLIEKSANYFYSEKAPAWASFLAPKAKIITVLTDASDHCSPGIRHNDVASCYYNSVFFMFFFSLCSTRKKVQYDICYAMSETVTIVNIIHRIHLAWFLYCMTLNDSSGFKSSFLAVGSSSLETHLPWHSCNRLHVPWVTQVLQRDALNQSSTVLALEGGYLYLPSHERYKARSCKSIGSPLFQIHYLCWATLFTHVCYYPDIK